MKSRDYEQLVRAIFQQLHDHDGLGDVIVEHDVVKPGKTTEHQIDVYWEFTKGGVSHRVVVQAKNWSRPVDKGEVLKFDGVLSDLPGQPRGIMVAANGYQRGAREAAAADESAARLSMRAYSTSYGRCHENARQKMQDGRVAGCRGFAKGWVGRWCRGFAR